MEISRSSVERKDLFSRCARIMSEFPLEMYSDVQFSYNEQRHKPQETTQQSPQVEFMDMPQFWSRA